MYPSGGFSFSRTNLVNPINVRGSYSARVPWSSLARVHREFVHHIVEDEVDGQEERQDDSREKMVSKERKMEKSKRIKHAT